MNSPDSIADQDIQGRGLNMALGGVGLENPDADGITHSGTITLDLSASVSVVSASLYWTGFSPISAGTAFDGAESELTINGVDITADRILGIENGGTGFFNIGFAKDVTGRDAGNPLGPRSTRTRRVRMSLFQGTRGRPCQSLRTGPPPSRLT